MLYLDRYTGTGTQQAHILGQYVIQTIKNSNVCRFFCTHKHTGPKSDVSGSFGGENFYYVSPRKLQAA